MELQQRRLCAASVRTGERASAPVSFPGEPLDRRGHMTNHRVIRGFLAAVRYRRSVASEHPSAAKRVHGRRSRRDRLRQKIFRPGTKSHSRRSDVRGTQAERQWPWTLPSPWMHRPTTAPWRTAWPVGGFPQRPQPSSVFLLRREPKPVSFWIRHILANHQQTARIGGLTLARDSRVGRPGNRRD